MKDFIIFLDFDGPLFSLRALELPENEKSTALPVCNEINLHPSVTYWKMDPCAVAMLNKMCSAKPNVKIVVSSSWANPLFHNKEHIQKLFALNGLKCKFHKDWFTPKVGAHRTEDIALWLKNHYVEDYIIFDDNESAPEMEDISLIINFKIQPSRVFLVSIAQGLSYSDYVTAMEIISSK